MKEIALGGRFRHLMVLVDDEDYDWARRYSWCRLAGRHTDYAVARVDGRVQQMHRLLAGASSGFLVDHANGRGLDNRRENLRLATRGQNQQNKKVRGDSQVGLKGVYEAKRGLFRAQIKHDGRVTSLGYHKDAEAAARAYDSAARELFGAFALTNFPEE